MFKDIDINSLIGIPYKDRGDTLEGFDCAGLVRHVTGIDVHIIPSVEEGNTKEIMKLMIENRRHFKKIDNPKDGCIVAIKSLKHNHHVGVYLHGGVLHCVQKRGVIFSTLQNLKENGNSWEFGELKNG